VIGGLMNTPDVGPLALLVLPVLPAAYFYVLYRRNLGGLELRTNRIISLYIFLVFLGIVLLLSVGFLGIAGISRETIVFGGVIVVLINTFLGIQYFPAFQSLVEKRLLGIKLPAKNMVENYSARIVTSTTTHGLLKLLEEEVFPSLLIRQYAFVETANPPARIMLCRDVDMDQVQGDALLDFVASAPAGQLIPLSASRPPFEWVRLMLPLRIGSELIGAWLLGRRDPDDHYPQAELLILRSLANQTAVALSNIIQTERLKVMYQANINRYEQERLRLAHDLHDSLLNEMAAMLMKHDPGSLPQDFQESFDGLIVRLREIVTDLRPALLIYGLKSALDGLADNLSERNHDSVQIRSEVQAMDDCRYPENVEQNVYRIVQEACENALKYAQASSIKITGELTFDQIDVQVTDDGIGLSDTVGLRLNDMVANKHYGLAGMHERADLIGATIRIDSVSNRGTHIHIRWKTTTM
jgi:signal transduction histidine kinase